MVGMRVLCKGGQPPRGHAPQANKKFATDTTHRCLLELSPVCSTRKRRNMRPSRVAVSGSTHVWTCPRLCSASSPLCVMRTVHFSFGSPTTSSDASSCQLRRASLSHELHSRRERAMNCVWCGVESGGERCATNARGVSALRSCGLALRGEQRAFAAIRVLA